VCQAARINSSGRSTRVCSIFIAGQGCVLCCIRARSGDSHGHTCAVKEDSTEYILQLHLQIFHTNKSYYYVETRLFRFQNLELELGLDDLTRIPIDKKKKIPLPNGCTPSASRGANSHRHSRIADRESRDERCRVSVLARKREK
jgi:hypothetical protein